MVEMMFLRGFDLVDWLVGLSLVEWLVGYWISGYDFGIVVNIAVVMPDFQAPVFVCDFGLVFPTEKIHHCHV